MVFRDKIISFFKHIWMAFKYGLGKCDSCRKWVPIEELGAYAGGYYAVCSSCAKRFNESDKRDYKKRKKIAESINNA